MNIIEILKGWIIDITIIFVLVSIIEMVIPNNSIKKYINIVTGLLIIIVIITPFINLIYRDYDIDKEVFKNLMGQNKTYIEDNSDLIGLQEKQIKEIYIAKMKEDISTVVSEMSDYEVDNIYISIYEDEENYGDVKEMEIVLKEKDLVTDKGTKDTIDVINIEEITVGEEHIEAKQTQLFENSEEIIDALNEKYNVDKSNIRIVKIQ